MRADDNQISFDTLPENQDDEREYLYTALKTEIDNPDYLKHLIVSRNTDETISIKAKSYLVAKVKLKGKSKYIQINKKYCNQFLDAAFSEAPKAQEDSVRIAIGSFDELIAYTRQLCICFVLVLSELGGESFGCCYRFEMCSDALKCIHPDVLTSFACAYKKNLEAGKVFYGKNKNITN